MLINILDGKHPDLDLDYLRINRALYSGGKSVRALLDKLLHKGAQEPELRYEARKQRAYYVNHVSAIVDQLDAWLSSTHPKVTSEPDDPDEFWSEFLGDCDLENHSLHQFQMGRVREAFITGKAWTLCELPKKKAPNAATLKDEDDVGDRRAYLVPLPTEAVIDWEHDEDGELLWAMVKNETMPRVAPTAARGLRVFTWTAYDRAGWTKYEWKQKKVGVSYDPAKDDAPQIDQGTHSFGCVPIEELGLPEGFYLLAKIQDHVIESFNSRCSKSFGMYMNLIPTVVHNKVQAIDGSDTQIQKTRLGAGYGVEIGEKEKLSYLETTGASFAFATEHIAELKDELYRVVHQMALSVDNSAGASKRSGDSKQQDKESSEIVLQALSEVEAPSRERKLDMIARARGEADQVDWDVTPVEKFTLKSAADSIEECIAAGAAGVRSPTFEKEREKKLVKALLPDLNEEIAEQIEQEIEDGVDKDPEGAMAQVTGGAEAPDDGEGSGANDSGTGGGAADSGKPDAKAGASIQRKANGFDGGIRQQRRSAAGNDRTRG